MDTNINEKKQQQDELKKLNETLTDISQKVEYIYWGIKDLPQIVSDCRKADKFVKNLRATSFQDILLNILLSTVIVVLIATIIKAVLYNI